MNYKVIEWKTRTDEELKKLAVDIVDGHVFHHQMCKHGRDINMVFMTIALGAYSGYSEESLKEIGLIYEYYSKAGPRSVNGMPIFFSHRQISKDDLKRLIPMLQEYSEFKKKFAGEKEGTV